MQADKKMNEIDIVPFARMGDFLLLDPKTSLISEWTLRKLLVEFGFTDPSTSKMKKTYSIVSVHIKGERSFALSLSFPSPLPLFPSNVHL